MDQILRIEELSDFSQFEAMQDIWNGILDSSRDNDIFSTWEWMLCWWKHFGDGRKLRILIVRDGNEIVGIAPLMLSNYNFLCFSGLKKIEFIGSRQSDYNNFVLRKKEIECLRFFLDHLVRNCSDWDYLQLSDIREDSLSANLQSKILCEETLGMESIVTTLCPYIRLPESLDAFMERLSPNMRRNLRKRKRRLQRDYRVEIKTQHDFGSIKEAMEVFFNLHQKRWRSKGDRGVFSKEALRRFHLDVAKLFAERGWLSMFFLTVNDKPVASAYSFDYGRKKYGYLTGFDPEYYPYSVGNLLKLHVIERCIQDQLEEYDLARGYEHYKAEWSTGTRKNLEIRLVRRGLFARMYDQATKNSVPVLLTGKLGRLLTPSS